MSTIGDDCYFFCTSSCSKGVNCPFRHVEAAKTCRIICQHWQMGGCFRPLCKFRHSDFPLPMINTAEIPCHWETQPSGCTKAVCPYKHSKPRPAKDNVAAKPAATPQTQLENKSQDNDKNSTALQFVRPVVDPVVIHPDSEASSSSPVKSNESMKKTEPAPKEIADEKTVQDVKENLKTKANESVKGYEEENVTTLKKKKPIKGNVKKKAKVPPKKVDKEKKIVKKKAAAPKKAQSVPTKKVSKPVSAKQKAVPKTKLNVKQRLGNSLKECQDANSESGSSDSDDSIENVKVLSMEEIFRQKALESMMKKRAAEGKPMLPSSAPSARKKPASSNAKRPISVSNNRKTPVPARKVFQKEESEEEEEEESDEEEEEESESKGDESEEESEEEEDSSSESSSADSSESSESEEETEAPRRVIIDVSDAKNRLKRKKAKENLQKKVPLRSNVKVKRREVLRESVFEEPPVKKPKHLSIHERLGMQQKLRNVEQDIEPIVKRTAQKRKLILQNNDDDDDDDDVDNDKEKEDGDGLQKIRIKTLEEIQSEKMKRLQSNQMPGYHSPEKVQPVKRTIMLRDEDNPSSLSDPGQVKTETKKVKKRPWKKPKPAPSLLVKEEDERTVSNAMLESDKGDAHLTLVASKDQEDETISPLESPTESLRRRALLKKALSQGKMGDNTDEITERSSSKKHKHKHKHKKKSKHERKLYIPPALKNTEREKKEVFEEEAEPQPDLQYPSIDEGPKSTAAPHRAVAQRVGALWAAGLNVPSRGLGVRSFPQKIETQKETKPPPPVVSKKPSLAPTQVKTQAKTTPSSVDLPSVKTFSQIMAEKRQKRLQQQQKQNAAPLPESSQVSVQPNVKSRVPIVFDSGNTSKNKEISPIQHNKTPSQESSKFPSLFKRQEVLNSGRRENDTLLQSNLVESKQPFKKISVSSDLDYQLQTKLSSSKENDKKEDSMFSPSIVPSKSFETEKISKEQEHKRRSTEDEFSFLDGEDFDPAVMTEDVEPIDDLLQDIDDLLN